VAARFDDRAVTELLERAVHEGVFPGAVLLVADAGQPIYVHACGHAQLVPEAGRRPATRDTVYDLASLTKPLATTLLSMRLHEAGLLDLDAPAQRLLPELVHARPRVRDLLAHAAGFPTHRPYWEHPRARTREDIYDLACREPLEYEPGTRSVYSDVGFLVLGRLIERLAGARLDVLVQALLPDGPAYGPAADAAATELGPDGTPLVGIVHDENARAMEGVAPHAGLFGTADDVHAALGALLGDTLVTGRTRERFFALAGVPASTWGLGWDHPAQSGYSAAGSRLPRQAVGHLAFTGCSIWMDPVRPFWVVLLSNRIHPRRDNTRIRDFRPLLHDAVCAAAGYS